MSQLETLRVRVNVISAGTLLALDERGAVVQLPTAQRLQKQTTLAIEDDDGGTLYIPARVVGTEPCMQPAFAPVEHQVAMEFFEMSRQTAEAIRHIIARRSTPQVSDAFGATSAGPIDTCYGRVA